MKKKIYELPCCHVVVLSSSDVITASNAFLGIDGIIELTSYGFGEDGFSDGGLG